MTRIYVLFGDLITPQWSVKRIWVNYYIERHDNGEDISRIGNPTVVMPHSDGKYVMSNGNHRAKALKEKNEPGLHAELIKPYGDHWTFRTVDDMVVE